MVCYLIGAGEVPRILPSPTEGDLVIAADGGLTHAIALGLTPDVIVGDFDSLGYVPTGAEVITLPVEKDMTDMAAAMEIGRARGYRDFYLSGGTGGRPDHTYANYQLLAACASRGEHAVLFGGTQHATAIADGGGLRFPASGEETLSVFAACGDARGVTETGVCYPLAGATLRATDPLGVSNRRLAGAVTEITVAHGTLLIFFEGEVLPDFS